MEKTHHTARKVKPKDRESWVIEFRHPLLKDSAGKSGKKIRKGLGTQDESIAEELVQQMNVILSSESLWNAGAKSIALSKFNPGIVEAFYSEIEYLLQDYEKIRESIIPLKTPSDGYARVLLLGATGVGKTTLLRQLIGTDPLKERFPATSTSRTTVFDTEIIPSEGSYKGVVTFFTEGETRDLIKDSVRNAMAEFFNRQDNSHTLRVLLEDKDQRFRLSYVIGKVKETRFSKYEGMEEEDATDGDLKISKEEQLDIEQAITRYLESIKTITNKLIQAGKNQLGVSDSLSEVDKSVVEELILSSIYDYEGEDLAELVDQVFEEVRLRFKSLPKQELVTEKFGWPIYWIKETNNRQEFIQAIRFFSSNSSSMFGKLLTPLVSGMRIQGPFKPDFLNEPPKVVLIDGEGLGHIPDTTSSLPSKTIKRFDTVDAIVLVDTSQNSMLASPYAVIKSAAISGHAQKLFICFTHFDAVKGDNLPTIDAKVGHIFGAVDNLLNKLSSELDYSTRTFLLNHLHQFSYYLGNMDEKLVSGDVRFRFTMHQLKELIVNLEKTKLSPQKNGLAPNYDVSLLLFKIQNGTKEFHSKWKGHLFGNATLAKEHFTRVKALARRLGSNSETEYDSLRPVSDLWSCLNTPISSFLSAPISWNLSNPPEKDKQVAIDQLRQKISAQINVYGHEALKNTKLSDWQKAFNLGGPGSARKRAEAIESIYMNAAPSFESDITPISRRFLMDIMKIVKAAIEQDGGEAISVFN